MAIGQVMLEQNDTEAANKMAEQANAAAMPGDLDAEILLWINCKLQEGKTAEALALIKPMTNGHSNVPQVWYLLGSDEFEPGGIIMGRRMHSGRKRWR